jgi:hypothetical protein
MKSRYSLRFELRPAEADRLIIGQLHFLRDGVIINTVRATSSLPGRQYPGSWEVKGGLLPPSKVLPKGKSYIMETEPEWMPDVAGVEGRFYQILPFEIPTVRALRGDFGGHYDARFPGSLGCIVMTTQRGWDAFRQFMALVLGQGITEVDLVVSYDTWSPAV